MKTSIKAKFNKADRQTNINKHRMVMLLLLKIPRRKYKFAIYLKFFLQWISPLSKLRDYTLLPVQRIPCKSVSYYKSIKKLKLAAPPGISKAILKLSRLKSFLKPSIEMGNSLCRVSAWVDQRPGRQKKTYTYTYIEKHLLE